MIIPDLNLIVFAHNADSPFHEPAREWWERLLNGDETVGLPWAIPIGFLRLTTNRHVFDPPLTVERATQYVERWFDSRAARIIEPGAGHLRHLTDLLRAVQAGGKFVPDAHLAALSIELRAVIHTHDRDFARFEGVRTFDPLANI